MAWLQIITAGIIGIGLGFGFGLLIALFQLESIIRKTRMEEQNEAMGNPYNEVPFQ